MRTYRRIATATTTALTLTLALGAASLMAPAAQAAATPNAGSLTHTAGELWYKGAPGQANRLRVSMTVEVRDNEFDTYYILTFQDRAPITIDQSAADLDECVYPTPSDHTIAQCAVGIPNGSDDSDIYDVDLGDGNDTATIDSQHNAALATIYGGKGNDVLRGNSAEVFYGQDGNDTISGGEGSWGLGAFGGAGNDTLTRCETTCHGGPGNDSLTGGADDGDDNTLYGDAGNDILHGKSGADLLYGGTGNDRLYGDAGNDKLYGNSGNDTLHGGAGTDTLSGGPGTDKLYQN
ncbi:calcium-binding protein [Streptomyces graminilatus]|uniref:calcium-binding protein n=1 Tax=Streptomyces graminilatus TaxID=1464070 RepID=UPI0006E2D1AE|nr:calcium-binding protein [Streptomyces graminilatus]